MQLFHFNSFSHILCKRLVRASDAHCFITTRAENNNLQVPNPNSNYMKFKSSLNPVEPSKNLEIFVNHIMLHTLYL